MAGDRPPAPLEATIRRPRESIPTKQSDRREPREEQEMVEQLILLIPDPENAAQISPDIIHSYKKHLAQIAARQILQRPGCTEAKKKKIMSQIIETYGPQQLHSSKSESELRVFKEKTLQLEMASKQDQLTGLQNRKGAEEGYDAVRQLEKMGIFHGQTVFARFDLDSFKLVNDLKGHPEGDRVLRLVAKHMEAKITNTANSEITKMGLRPTDVHIRFSGDEFGLVLTDVKPGKDKGGNILSIEETIKHILSRVIESIEDINLELPADVKDKIFISASMGYSILPKGVDISFDEASERADQAAKLAKLLKSLQHKEKKYRSGKSRVINSEWTIKSLPNHPDFSDLDSEELEDLEVIQNLQRPLEAAMQAVDEETKPILRAQMDETIKIILKGIHDRRIQETKK